MRRRSNDEEAIFVKQYAHHMTACSRVCCCHRAQAHTGRMHPLDLHASGLAIYAAVAVMDCVQARQQEFPELPASAWK